jgi:hypothetical protein
MIEGLPMACVSTDLGFFTQVMPTIPKNDGNWVAICQAQPSFQQED